MMLCCVNRTVTKTDVSHVQMLFRNKRKSFVKFYYRKERTFTPSQFSNETLFLANLLHLKATGIFQVLMQVCLKSVKQGSFLALCDIIGCPPEKKTQTQSLAN